MSYISGAVKMMQRLRKERKSGAELCIYLWVTGGFLSLVLLSGFRLLKIPVVLEVNEWWPGRMNEFYRRCAHRLSDGSLPISTEIEQRLISWDGYRQHPRKIYRLPVLIDTEAWAPQESVPPVQSPYYLWCGNVDASEQDVRFILNAFSLAQKREPEMKLLFCGRTSSEMKQRIHNWADESGLSQAQVCLPGYVTESELKDFMRHATGLLLPLWQEERSLCRFPTKLGEYLASSAPVVSSKTGDVGRFLDDGVSALLNEPGDGAGFAKSLVDLASDTKKAEQIGAAGRRVAKEKLDFRVHQEALYNCFSSCIKKG
jgi:glycosyltransferase involved in cell wall biosynthesis